MGLMKRLFSSEKLGTPTNGSVPATNTNDGLTHNISKSTVLGATAPGAISHQNADFSSIRTVPVCQQPRYFTKQEAEALKQLSKLKREQAAQAQLAYKALKGIDNSDTEVHTVHRGYQAKIARNELEKLQANAKLAETLHAQRAQYSELDSRVNMAETNASNAISAIKQSYGV